MKALIIIFDSPYEPYLVGETVAGRIEFTLTKSKKVRGIILQVKGEAKVSWKGKEITYINQNGQETKTDQITYEGKEEYFKVDNYCLGSKENQGTTLSVGKHVYPFSFVLPINMPSSFEGKHGYIRYTVNVILERPSKWNQETKTTFTVISPYSPNLHSNLEQQVIASDRRFFGWGYCTSRSFEYLMMIPKSSFVPRENMPVIVEIDNHSNVLISEVVLKLQQSTAYHSQKPFRTIKHEEIVLEKIQLGQLGKRISNTWTQVLVIPSVPPSLLQNCTIISTEYRLLLEITVSYHLYLTTFTLSTPITIGTVPLNRRLLISKADPNESPDYEMATTSTRNIQSNNIVPEIAASTLSTNKFYNTKSIRDYDDNERTTFLR